MGGNYDPHKNNIRSPNGVARALDPIRFHFPGSGTGGYWTPSGSIFRSKLQTDFYPLKSCPIESIRPPKWSAGPCASFEGHLCFLMKTVGFHQHPADCKYWNKPGNIQKYFKKITKKPQRPGSGLMKIRQTTKKPGGGWVHSMGASRHKKKAQKISLIHLYPHLDFF